MSEYAETMSHEYCFGVQSGVQSEIQPPAPSVAPHRKTFPLPGDRAVWGRDRHFRVEHLRLELAFDLRRREVQGVATTTFRPRHDGLREAVFDAIELEIDAVTDGEGSPLAFREDGRSLRVELGGERREGEPLAVTVRYRCRPRRGLYFNLPDESYPDRPTQIWTQGQAEDSPYYFPCLDFPGERFTTELLATVPLGWTAISNGRLAGVEEDRRRRRATFHWVQDIPHPAYLVTLAAGEFDAVEESAAIGPAGDGAEVPVQYYGAKGTAADLRRAFGRTPEMVRFFSERIGVPYPWPKYATVAVADFIFGGMENTSATTMTDTLLHDERAHEDMVERCDSISAHELAHQWFGDLLTCREWSHGWLNESFATYFDALFVEHHRGWDDFRYTVWQNAKAYLDEDAKRYRRPIVENVYRDPIDIFDRHLYERGSVVLDMLRDNLGDELWWKAIRHYVETYRERDVLTHDFQRAVEEATGRNLDWFFDQWVWKAGHPEFRAAYEWDGERHLATVRLEQTQQPDALTSIYRTPVEIGFMTKDGFERRRVEVTEAAHAFVFPFDDEPEFVSIDPAWRVLKTLTFEPGERQLRERLRRDPEAMGRIEAAKGLAKLGSPRAVEALREALLDGGERDIVRAEVAAALGEAKAEAARDALVEAAQAEPARVRRAVATALGNFRDERAARTLAGYLAGAGDRSYYVQAEAAAALGRTRQASAYRVLTRALGRPSHNDVITAGALAGLGSLRDLRALDTLLDYTRWGVHQNARRAAVSALGDLGPHGDSAQRLRVRERLEELLDDRWLRVATAAVDGLERLGEAGAAPALESAAARALDGRIRRNARVAARTLRERADKGEEVRSLRDEVDRLRQEGQALKDRIAKLEARLDRSAEGGVSPDGATAGSRSETRTRGAR